MGHSQGQFGALHNLVPVKLQTFDLFRKMEKLSWNANITEKLLIYMRKKHFESTHFLLNKYDFSE